MVFNAAVNLTKKLYPFCKDSIAWEPSNVERYKECTNQISGSNSEIKGSMGSIKRFVDLGRTNWSVHDHLEHILEATDFDWDATKGLENAISYINSVSLTSNQSESNCESQHCLEGTREVVLRLKIIDWNKKRDCECRIIFSIPSSSARPILWYRNKKRDWIPLNKEPTTLENNFNQLLANISYVLSNKTLENVSLLDLPAFGSIMGTLKMGLKEQFTWPIKLNFASLGLKESVEKTRISASYKTLTQDWANYMKQIHKKNSESFFTSNMKNDENLNFTEFIRTDMKSLFDCCCRWKKLKSVSSIQEYFKPKKCENFRKNVKISVSHFSNTLLFQQFLFLIFQFPKTLVYKQFLFLIFQKHYFSRNFCFSFFKNPTFPAISVSHFSNSQNTTGLQAISVSHFSNSQNTGLQAISVSHFSKTLLFQEFLFLIFPEISTFFRYFVPYFSIFPGNKQFSGEILTFFQIFPEIWPFFWKFDHFFRKFDHFSGNLTVFPEISGFYPEFSSFFRIFPEIWPFFQKLDHFPGNLTVFPGIYGFYPELSSFVRIFPEIWLFFQKLDHFSGNLTIFLEIWPFFRKFDHFSGNLTIFPENLTIFPEIWPLFRKFPVFTLNFPVFSEFFRKFDCFSGNLTIFSRNLTIFSGNLTIFSRKFDHFFGNLTIFPEIWPFFPEIWPFLLGNLTIFSEIWPFIRKFDHFFQKFDHFSGNLTIFLEIWPFFQKFDHFFPKFPVFTLNFPVFSCFFRKFPHFSGKFWPLFENSKFWTYFWPPFCHYNVDFSEKQLNL